jgi:hypothetical protein
MSSLPLDESEAVVERKTHVMKPHIVKKSWGIIAVASRGFHSEVFNEPEWEVAREWCNQRSW